MRARSVAARFSRSCCRLPSARKRRRSPHPGAGSLLRLPHGRRSRAGRLAVAAALFRDHRRGLRSRRAGRCRARPPRAAGSIAAIVSSPENITRLEEIRANALRLADPRTLDEAAATAIAERQPVIVAIGMSIHATEIAATQAAPELLHTLATSQRSRGHAITQ